MSVFNSMYNRAVWFDIPVCDLDRAASFYRAVLGVRVEQEKFGDTALCVIEHDQGNGGCLVVDEAEISGSGVLVYLNVNGRIQDAVSKVVPNGGTLIRPVHAIGRFGFRAIVIDSEGNRVALHSESDR